MSDTVAAGQLRALIERIERVEAEIKDLNADKSDIYKEARGVGYDVKAIRQCVAARKLDSAEREERDAIFDLYWNALTGGSRVHVHEEPRDADTGEIIERHFTRSATPDGLDGSPSTPSPEAGGAKMDEVQAHPDRAAPAEVHSANSGQAVTHSDEDVPAFLMKDHKPLRPNCLNPADCAGYGRVTCHRCLTAAGQSEVAA